VYHEIDFMQCGRQHGLIDWPLHVGFGGVF